MTISLPIEKRDKIVHCCKVLLDGDKFTIRFVSRVIGMLVASQFARRSTRGLFYRYLEHYKITALKYSAGDFDASMNLSQEARSELFWWVMHGFTCYKHIRSPPTLVITTDVSMLGWGAVFNEQSTGEQWPQ